MRFETFSKAQLRALTWWCDSSPYKTLDAIICDGAVRSGKTLCMGVSFISWAMGRFDGARFGLCGKSVTSLRRNLVSVLLPVMGELGFECSEKISSSTVTVSFAGRSNTFYLFGGRDESSAALIQGVTLAGVLMDEVALMPRSFVEQAMARCSVEGAKLWFSCNPEGPGHWFYTEWIKDPKAKKALYIHFSLEDNPALSPQVVERYKRLYKGTFYRRFILGEWVAAEGLIYDFFTPELLRPAPEGEAEEYAVSCDYGTANPASFGLWGRHGRSWYRLREYYWDSRREGRQKTDGEYIDDLAGLLDGASPSFIVADPSAASFIEGLSRAGYPVRKADNDVLTGIRRTSELLRQGRLVITPGCADAIREFSLYRWDDRAAGRDSPVKTNDHAMDDIRYFAMAVSGEEDCFASVWVER